MKSHLEPVTRRKFLNAGLAGDAIAATLPVWRHFSFAAPPADFYVNPAVNLPKETLEMLLKLALRHGGEFSEVYVEYTVRNQIQLEGSGKDRPLLRQENHKDRTRLLR